MTAVVAPTRIRFMRRFVTRRVNPLTRTFAGWMPGFGVLTHVGRKSGRMYRTPLNPIRRGDHYVFFLTYGSDVDWVKNIFAAGRCEIRVRGRDVELVDPELIVDPELRLVPAIVRAIGRWNRVTELLLMRVAD
jgi:deazaflavin-dependent oxidoreductase (nitroreductase family)